MKSVSFTVLKDFYDDDLKSHYIAGLVYTARSRPPNPKSKGDQGVSVEETLLYKKLQGWLKEGKARLGGAAASGPHAAAARIKGTGTVQ